MADEQPNTPLEGAPAPDGAAPEPVSDEPRQESSHWWDRLLNKRPASEATGEGGEPGADGGTSGAVRLTQEELDRRVQAETDRREAQRVARQKVEERKRLRDEDPWAYAAQDREAEQAQDQQAGVTSFFANVGTQHDRIAIDPLMEALPVAERQRIMNIDGAGKGLDGRKLVVGEALKALEKQWKAEGEKTAQDKLRRNPAFRKQVLAEARGGFVEPELVPGISSSAADQKVSDILRSYYRVGGSEHHSAG